MEAAESLITQALTSESNQFLHQQCAKKTKYVTKVCIAYAIHRQ